MISTKKPLFISLLVIIIFVSISLLTNSEPNEPSEIYLGACEGIIHDAKGIPINGAEVSVKVNKPTGKPALKTLSKSPNGHYLIINLDAIKGDELIVVATYNGTSGKNEGVAVQGGYANINVTIPIEQQLKKEENNKNNMSPKIIVIEYRNESYLSNELNDSGENSSVKNNKTKTSFDEKEEVTNPNYNNSQSESNIVTKEKTQKNDYRKSPETTNNNFSSWMLIIIIIFIISLIILIIKK